MDELSEVFSNEHARCIVARTDAVPEHMQERIREVSKVYTDAGHRKQGYGTQLMQQVCEFADLNNFVLILTPSPQANTITKDKLMDWYKRFGFVKTQDSPVLMARAPSFKVRQGVVSAAVEKLIG